MFLNPRKAQKTIFQMSTFLLEIEMKELTSSKTQLKAAALRVQKPCSLFEERSGFPGMCGQCCPVHRPSWYLLKAALPESLISRLRRLERAFSLRWSTEACRATFPGYEICACWMCCNVCCVKKKLFIEISWSLLPYPTRFDFFSRHFLQLKVRLDFCGSVVLVRMHNFPQTAFFRVFLEVWARLKNRKRMYRYIEKWRWCLHTPNLNYFNRFFWGSILWRISEISPACIALCAL